MGKESTCQHSGGPGGLQLLTILFIAFKLLGVITWSWWWVLAPLWIGVPIALVILVIGKAILLVLE